MLKWVIFLHFIFSLNLIKQLLVIQYFLISHSHLNYFFRLVKLLNIDIRWIRRNKFLLELKLLKLKIAFIVERLWCNYLLSSLLNLTPRGFVHIIGFHLHLFWSFAFFFQCFFCFLNLFLWFELINNFFVLFLSFLFKFLVECFYNLSMIFLLLLGIFVYD